MTNIKIVKNEELITRIQVSEHADYADAGNDIVCAGISAVIFGGLNALVNADLDERRIEIKEAFVNVDLTDSNIIQIIAQTIIIQLQTIQESYPDYINIEIK